MVTVSLSEVYDLSTVTDRMTLIGIHTPTKELIQKTYPGLCMNSKYCRIVKTDVVLSAVSGTVAITPDMVGDNAVDGIAPEDVLNPILYKAVSNDSWSTLEARLHGLLAQAQGLEGSTVPLTGSQAFAENNDVTGLTDEFGVYYSLLSNRDGFKISPIQNGCEMRGLRPLVFDKWYTHGENAYEGGDDNDKGQTIIEPTNGGLGRYGFPAHAMRGKPHPMPRFNTSYITGVSGIGDLDNSGVKNGMGNGLPRNIQAVMPDIAPVMLGCIIMPPCRKTKLFFRMSVRTFIEFTEVRPIQEITSFAQMNDAYAPLVYHSDYNVQSSKMDNLTDMVDTKNADITKIMEGR